MYHYVLYWKMDTPGVYMTWTCLGILDTTAERQLMCMLLQNMIASFFFFEMVTRGQNFALLAEELIYTFYVEIAAVGFPGNILFWG